MQAGDKVERLSDNVTGVAVGFEQFSEEWLFVFHDAPHMVQAGPESQVRILASHGDKPGMSLADNASHAQTLKYARQAGEFQGVLGFAKDALEHICHSSEIVKGGQVEFEANLAHRMVAATLLRVAEM